MKTEKHADFQWLKHNNSEDFFSLRLSVCPCSRAVMDADGGSW